jgi:hypothetical protein
MPSSWHATPIRLHHGRDILRARTIRDKNGMTAFLLIIIDVWILSPDLMTN